MTWSISVSSGQGTVNVWPYQTGTLPSGGDSVTVYILASHRAAGRQVTVSPGGAVFTISSGGGPFADLARPHPALARYIKLW